MESRVCDFIINNIAWFFVSVLFVGNTVSAQDAASVPAGPFDITPTLNVSYEDNDNFTQSATNEQSVNTAIVVPALSAVADNGVTRYELTYRVENGQRSGPNASFDYTDQQFGAEVDWLANVRNRIVLGWSLSEGHDEPSADNSGQQNEYENTNLSFRYTFGADGARGRVILGLAQSDLEYTNNRTASAVILNPTAILDSGQLTTDLSFLFGLGGSSRLVFQVLNTDVEFDNNASRNRKDQSYFAGLEWDITDKTLGTIRLGQTKTDLELGEDTTGAAWRVNLAWTPREYTSFSLDTSRRAENGVDNIGDFSQVSSVTVSWDYQWTSRFSSSLSWSTTEDDFQNANGRVDDTDAIVIGFRYSIKRWLSLGAALESRERSSTFNPSVNEYDQNIARLTFNMSL